MRYLVGYVRCRKDEDKINTLVYATSAKPVRCCGRLTRHARKCKKLHLRELGEMENVVVGVFKFTHARRYGGNNI